MEIYVKVLIAVIALFHLYFLWLEMFAWTTRAPKVFKGFPADYFKKTKSLAANQGLYNGFLVAGLVWSLLITESPWNFYIAIFFLSCIVIAGIFGALTASKTIFYVQALPAIIALVLLHL